MGQMLLQQAASQGHFAAAYSTSLSLTAFDTVWPTGSADSPSASGVMGHCMITVKTLLALIVLDQQSNSAAPELKLCTCGMFVKGCSLSEQP